MLMIIHAREFLCIHIATCNFINAIVCVLLNFIQKNLAYRGFEEYLTNAHASTF